MPYSLKHNVAAYFFNTVEVYQATINNLPDNYQVVFNGSAEFLARKEEEFFQPFVEKNLFEGAWKDYRHYSAHVDTAKESMATAMIHNAITKGSAMIIIVKITEE